MSDYVAVVKRTGGSDELEHFKYIKREKKNGKWVYYYDNSELNKYKDGSAQENIRRKDNVYGGQNISTRTTKYQQSDKLFDSESKITSVTSSGKNVYDTVETIKKQGKLSRAQAKAEKWIYDKFLSNSAKTKMANVLKSSNTKAGSKAADKILSKKSYNRGR